MKKISIYSLLFILATSCRTNIDKVYTRSTDKADFKVEINDYSDSKKRLNGKITIDNKTNDTLIFNFHQALVFNSKQYLFSWK